MTKPDASAPALGLAVALIALAPPHGPNVHGQAGPSEVPRCRRKLLRHRRRRANPAAIDRHRRAGGHPVEGVHRPRGIQALGSARSPPSTCVSAARLEASYDPAHAIGDPDNIRHRIITFLPGRLIVFQNIQAPHALPGAEAFKRTVTILEYQPLGPDAHLASSSPPTGWASRPRLPAASTASSRPTTPSCWRR